MRKIFLLIIFSLGIFFGEIYSQQINNQPQDKDLGIDFVVVKNENVNLRSNSNTSSTILTLVQKKERLILLNRKSDNGFYLVTDLNRSLKGWINSDFIEIWFTNAKTGIDPTRSAISEIKLPKPKLPACSEPQNFVVNDPGTDMVKVNADGLYLLSSNESVSYVLKSLTKKDNLIYISHTSDNKGYEVFDTDTNQKGWVSCLETTVFLTKKPKQNLSFEENKSTTSTEPPTLVIENKKNSELTFWLDYEKFILAPLSSKSIKVTRGTSSYIATFPKANPISGVKNWENGVVYSLRFN